MGDTFEDSTIGPNGEGLEDLRETYHGDREDLRENINSEHEDLRGRKTKEDLSK